MNKDIFSFEEMMAAFELFTDRMLNDAINYEDYLPKFREYTGVKENSPFEFMFRGFIGGLYLASCAEEEIKVA